MKTKSLLAALGLLSLCSIVSSCGQQEEQKTSNNPHAYVTNIENVKMITSLNELDPDRLYEMNYTADYKLDKLIESNVTDIGSLVKFVSEDLFDVMPDITVVPSFSSGCSAYAATETSRGDFLMGRNYDYCHVEKGVEVPITALFVRTAPEGGKKSIAMVDTYWLGYHKGFYNDGVSDLSMLMAAPYEILDGINESGFAICVLHLEGKATIQNDPEKQTLWTNIMMRKVLDNASTVEEALEIVKDFNVTMVTPASGNFHFFLADATGDYAILEYSYDDADSVNETLPNTMKVFKGEDCDRYVTNFYVDPALAEHPKLGPLGKHGLWRYDTLKANLTRYNYRLTDEQAIDLLRSVSQGSNPNENTSHTQWSALYNLTQKKVDISILQEFEKNFTFKVE